MMQNTINWLQYLLFNSEWLINSNELIFPRKVKLAVTNHKIADEMLECTKPLAFLMDPPKDREEDGKPAKKKQKKGGWTDKNFGSIIDIAQFKKAKRLTLGWRCRPPKTGH